MRHNKKLNHLSRTSAHRKAMLANMAASLILHKRIKTTTAKAKALRVYIEPLLTRAKLDNTHNRRVVFKYLQNKYAVAELFREVSQKIANREGGYTRVLKIGARLGDNAQMAIIELVDYNESLLEAKETAKKSSSRRSRRGRGKGKQETHEGTPAEKVETPVGEEEVKEENVVEEKTEQVAEEKTEEKETEKAEEKTEEKAEEKPEETPEEKVDSAKSEKKETTKKTEDKKEGTPVAEKKETKKEESKEIKTPEDNVEEQKSEEEEDKDSK